LARVAISNGCIFCFLFVAGMTGLIWWQWRAKNPIMNLRLFKHKNFAICWLLMILVGGVLNAATVLEPQFLQQRMGYTATRAGEALRGEDLFCSSLCPWQELLPAGFRRELWLRSVSLASPARSIAPPRTSP
jgi:hypothetical protein